MKTKIESKSSKPETLVKTSKKGGVELSESDLKKVAGGVKLDTYK